MSETSKWLLLATLFLLLATPGALLAQAVSGTINGYVYDTSNAVIAGAQVTVTNTETGVATARTTDDTGRYIVTNLPPGNYSVSVEATGFRRFVQENIILRIDSTVRLDANLDLGGVTEQVTISGAPPMPSSLSRRSITSAFQAG